MRGSLPSVVGAGLVLSTLWSLGCTPYRIEYHKRPSFYKQATDQDLPDEVTLEDGTIVRFIEQDASASIARDDAALPDDSTESMIRIRSDDGAVTLHAHAPQHVLAHAKRGIRQREYQLLWDQLLADRTKAAYARDGKGFSDFAAFCEANRPAMMETFNRMGFGLFSPDVIQESLGTDGFRYRLHPRLGDQFAFTEFDVVRESSGMKWLIIR